VLGLKATVLGKEYPLALTSTANLRSTEPLEKVQAGRRDASISIKGEGDDTLKGAY
jgi:hypothetical protein